MNRPNMPRMKVELTEFLTGTWNVRSLYRAGHLTTMISELERYRLDMIAIQETRWPGNDNLRTGNWTIFYSGGTEHQNGVGFIGNDKILLIVKKFEAINDRICCIEIESKWFNIVIVNCYAPTEDKEDEIKDTFYDRLDAIYDLYRQIK